MGNRAVILWRIWLYICTSIQIFLRLFHNENLLHQDRFARPEEIYKQRTPKPNPKSILLGKLKGGDFVAVHATTTRPELGNLLVVGRTRSGKGLNIDSQLLNWEDSAIVNDPKGGEAYDHTAKFRSGLGRIIAFNPEGKGHRFDPFHNNKTEDDFLNSATLLLQHGDEGQNFIFTKRAI